MHHVGPASADGEKGREMRLAALGDSLVAGYGLPLADGFVPRLEAALRERGWNVTVINAGVSGDTAAGGLSRLEWTLADKPDAMLVELGANDMLRGLDPEEARANLEAILKRLDVAGIPTLLVGMRATPSLGQAYVSRFNDVHPSLARRFDVPLYPFFLEGVASDPSLNQGDGIHPNAAGVREIVQRITPSVVKLLETVAPSMEGKPAQGN